MPLESMRNNLEALLLDPGMDALKAASASGELTRYIPEWARLTSSENIQHATHHYPLDEHTFLVVEGTKGSSYFQQLSPYQKKVTVLAAILHDIAKNTGPARLREKIPVERRNSMNGDIAKNEKKNS